jgi:hypothetical protein
MPRAEAKALFAPVPLRAMSMKLSGVEYATLICVASHDRLSLNRGSGQGCNASNNRMAALTGFSYAKLCNALSTLVERGLLKRQQPGRKTVYRVIYNDDDKALFKATQGAAICAQSGTNQPETCDQSGTETTPIGAHSENVSLGNQSANQAQYISLNEEINSSEEGGINSSEEAHLAARLLPKGSEALPIEAQLQRFERALKAEPWTMNLAERIEWLGRVAEEHWDNTRVGHWAMRLVGDAEDALDFQRTELVDPAAVQAILARTARSMKAAA